MLNAKKLKFFWLKNKPVLSDAKSLDCFLNHVIKLLISKSFLNEGDLEMTSTTRLYFIASLSIDAILSVMIIIQNKTALILHI